MQNSGLRVGIEVEMHGLAFTFRRTTTNQPNRNEFWPLPGANVDEEDTMMGHDPILVPESFNNNAADQTLATLDWQGDWGFIVAGDAFGTAAGTVQANGAQVNYCRCIALELNSAAHELQDARYWVVFRRAAQLFKESLLEFVPANARPNGDNIFSIDETYYRIDDFIAVYNAKINQLWIHEGWGVNPNPANWRIKKSYHLEQFETQASGMTYKGVSHKWRAIFAVRKAAGVAGPNVGIMAHEIRCDAQVNYQVDLEYLWEHTDEWFELWGHMYLHGSDQTALPGRVDVDPNIGYLMASPINMVYRNQITLALFRAAKVKAAELVNLLLGVSHLNLPGLSTQSLTQLKATIMLMYAIAAISPPPAGAGMTPKNSYSQMPKTAPASIVACIGAVSGSSLTALRSLGRGDPIHDAPFNDDSIAAYVREVIKNDIRAANALSPYLPGGAAHDVKMQPGYSARYRDPFRMNDDILTRALTDLKLENVWKGSFNFIAVNAGNKFGYKKGAPFHCYWALAHTPKAAVRTGTTGKISILFESRYGHNWLNLGFNPDTTEETFYHAYRNLLALTLPTKPERSARLGILKTYSSSSSRSKYRKKFKKAQKRGQH